jgi:hypothetical protein
MARIESRDRTPAPAQCRAKRGAQARSLSLPLSEEEERKGEGRRHGSSGPAHALPLFSSSHPRFSHQLHLQLRTEGKGRSTFTRSPSRTGARPEYQQRQQRWEIGKADPVVPMPLARLVSPGRGFLSSKWQQLKRRRRRARTGM